MREVFGDCGIEGETPSRQPAGCRRYLFSGATCFLALLVFWRYLLSLVLAFSNGTDGERSRCDLVLSPIIQKAGREGV